MDILSIVNFLADTGSSVPSDLAPVMDVIESVVDTITLIIYIVLGLFLGVKGAILGMQIVKAADEPQVRQEKIGSLKWLVIGVAIAYGVTAAVDILTGYISKTLSF